MSWLNNVVAQDQDVIVQTANVSTLQAPLLTSTSHAKIGQNFRVLWYAVAPGAGGVASLYGACTNATDRGQGPPPLFQLNLQTGVLTEFTRRGELIRDERAAEGADKDTFDEIMGKAKSESGEALTTAWIWNAPMCLGTSLDGKMWFGEASGWIVRYFQNENAFRQVVRLNNEVPAGIAVTKDESLYVLTKSHALYLRDLTGIEKLDKLKLPEGPIAGLTADSAGNLYTAVGESPCQLFSVQIRQRHVEATPLKLPEPMALVRFHWSRTGPWCECVTTNDKPRTLYYRLDGGRAVALDKPPDFELTVDFNRDPSITVTMPGTAPRHIAMEFKKATWAPVKALTVGPDGRRIYGSGAAPAWIWEFDPDANSLRRLGADYVWYNMIPYGNEIFAVGYYGIKFMRFDPNRRWTDNFEKDWSSASPWGAKDTNPRLVAVFRYFNSLNIRRPSGFALGGDGRFYAGGHDAAHMFMLHSPPHMEGTRYCGALCWYEPQTETIGIERGPFLHHVVTHICAIGDDYIAMVGKADSNPFDPDPNHTEGKFALFDLHLRRFVHDEDLTGRKLLYVAEGQPGQVVIAAPPSAKYAGDGITGMLVVFDVKTMKTTRIVRLPVEIRWNQYDAAGKFVRGPDGCVYFYGTDKDGTALFRFHSDTGVVEPVYREPGVSDFAVYKTPGPAFCFAKDRVYFGTTELHSLPLEKIVADVTKLPPPAPSKKPAVLASTPVTPPVEKPRSKTDKPVATPIVPAVWRWPHEIVWQSTNGPTWYSVGHTATILAVEPVSKNETLREVKLSAFAVNSFDESTHAPRDLRLLDSFSIQANDPQGGEQKRGLHRRPKNVGDWDFGFGKLPKADFTFLRSMFFQRSEQFRYCLTVHAEGKTTGAAEKSFKQLNVYVLISQLWEDPTLVDRSSWPAGAPMPMGLKGSSAWYASEAVKAPWASTQPFVHVQGKLEALPDGTLRCGPSVPSESPAQHTGPTLDGSTDDKVEMDDLQ